VQTIFFLGRSGFKVLAVRQYDHNLLDDVMWMIVLIGLMGQSETTRLSCAEILAFDSKGGDFDLVEPHDLNLVPNRSKQCD
jgi:hypothetical protein